jgi:hypothetical protein
MTEFVVVVLALIPLDVLSQVPTPTPSSAVYPQRSQGFAAYIVGGFFGLAILILAMMLLNHRPKRINPRPPDE